MNSIKISLENKDALREILSIGIGHASGALSKMTGKKIKIHTTDLRIVSSVSDLISDSDVSSVGMLLNITDGLEGSLLLLSSRKDSLRMSDIILKNSFGKEAKLGEINTDVLREMGNILVGSYLSALSTFTGLNLLESTPMFVFDKADKIGELVQDNYKDKIKYFFALETILTVSRNKFKQKMILVLTNNSFNKLFNAMVDNNLK